MTRAAPPATPLWYTAAHARLAARHPP